MMIICRRYFVSIALLFCVVATNHCLADPAIKVSLRSQAKDPANDDDAYRYDQREEVWDAGETAVIVCDMWDSHHCYRTKSGASCRRAGSRT
jgi:hypothetical protein